MMKLVILLTIHLIYIYIYIYDSSLISGYIDNNTNNLIDIDYLCDVNYYHALNDNNTLHATLQALYMHYK